MADVSIANLPPLVAATPPAASLVPFTDTTDHIESPQGTTKHMTVAQLFTSPPISGSLTLTNLTLTGNLVVQGTSNLQGPVTLNSTLLVSGATTLAGALNINGGATFTGTGTLTVLFNTTTGAASDVIQLVLQRASANKWRIGMNPSGLNADSFDIYNESLGNALSVAKATNAATFVGTLTVGIGTAARLWIGGPTFPVLVPSATLLNVELGDLSDWADFKARAATFTGAVTVGGLITANAGIQFPAAGSFLPGSIFRSATSGLSVACVGGSVYDFALPNAAGSLNVIAVPTGTVNVRFGGEITPGPLSAFSPAVIGTYGPYGLYLQGKAGSSYDFAIGRPDSTGLILQVPTGTSDVQLLARLSVGGAFGCNAKPPSSAIGIGAAATDLTSVINLANGLRSMAITFGLGV